MSYTEKQYRHRLSLGHRNNALVILVAVNMILYVAFAFIRALNMLGAGSGAPTPDDQDIFYWVALPADLSAILSRPWTILTYAFAHSDIWAVIANMLWLGFFGYIMQDLTGNRKLFPVYIYGALAGALAFVLGVNFIPALQVPGSSSVLLGASAGIMAVAVAATAIAPGYRLLPMLNGGIPLWIITSLYALIDLAAKPLSSPASHVADLAGALTGFLFVFFYRQGFDASEWMSRLFDWVDNLFNPDKPKKGSADIRVELFYKSSAPPYKRTPNVTQQRIDEILDKINQSNYDALTEEEKELLRRAAQEDI